MEGESWMMNDQYEYDDDDDDDYGDTTIWAQWQSIMMMMIMKWPAVMMRTTRNRTIIRNSDISKGLLKLSP